MKSSAWLPDVGDVRTRAAAGALVPPAWRRRPRWLSLQSSLVRHRRWPQCDVHPWHLQFRPFASCHLVPWLCPAPELLLVRLSRWPFISPPWGPRAPQGALGARHRYMMPLTRPCPDRPSTPATLSPRHVDTPPHPPLLRSHAAGLKVARSGHMSSRIISSARDGLGYELERETACLS